MRTETVQALADGIVKALTQPGAKENKAALLYWQFWQGDLDPEDMAALYGEILKQALIRQANTK